MNNPSQVKASSEVSAIAYSVDRIRAISGVGRTTIYQAIKSGDLKSIKIGARRLVLDQDLRAWLEAHRVG